MPRAELLPVVDLENPDTPPAEKFRVILLADATHPVRSAESKFAKPTASAALQLHDLGLHPLDVPYVREVDVSGVPRLLVSLYVIEQPSEACPQLGVLLQVGLPDTLAFFGRQSLHCACNEEVP